MKHLRAIAKSIPVEYIDRGKAWYRDANAFAEYLSHTYKVSFDRVCGVLSSLSPGCPWDRNKSDAERLITCYVCGGEWQLLPFATYSANVAKAWAILASADRGVHEFFNPRTGAKTLNFYHNILNPDNPAYVTIDRHMIAVYEGRIGRPSGSKKLTPKQYQEIVTGLGKLAKKMGLQPCELQAAIWEYHLGLIKNN